MLWNRPCQNLFLPNETMAHHTMLTTILGGRDPQGRPIPEYIKAIPPFSHSGKRRGGKGQQQRLNRKTISSTSKGTVCVLQFRITLLGYNLHTPLLCKFYLFPSGWVLFNRIHVLDVNTKVEQEELEELRGQA